MATKIEYSFFKNRSLSIKEMGAIPQSETTKMIAFNIDRIGYEGPIVAPLIPPEPILLPNAKLTTILNVVSVNSGIFIICRDYFIDFLKDFELGEYTVWPMKFHYKNSVLDNYHLFHISYPIDNELIDYENSKFSIGKIGDWRDKGKRKRISIKNYINYIGIREKLIDSGNEIKHEKIVLDFSHAKEDIIRLETPPVRGYYFSEKLIKELKKQRFTGFSFFEIAKKNKNVELKKEERK